MDPADHWHFRAHNPTHDAASFFTYTFDVGHKVGEITKLAEKFTRPLDRRV